MIPKNQIEKSEPMMTLEQAETLIDEGLRRGAAVRTFDLHPVAASTVERIVQRYSNGGWSVRTENLRMPNGYRVTLS